MHGMMDIRRQVGFKQVDAHSFLDISQLDDEELTAP